MAKKHSEVGIITNSSTEIFTFPRSDAVEIAKDYLKAFVEEGTKVEDSFLIALGVDDEKLSEEIKDGWTVLDYLADEECEDFPYIEGESWEQTRERWQSLPEDKRKAIALEFLLKQGERWYDCMEGSPILVLKVEVLPGAKLIKPVDIGKVVSICSQTESVYC